jgi:hypothetical protein
MGKSELAGVAVQLALITGFIALGYLLSAAHNYC